MSILKPLLLPAAIMKELELQFQLLHDSDREQLGFDKYQML